MASSEVTRCFPFADGLNSDCCSGGPVDAPCVKYGDCRGRLECRAGRCTGDDGCGPFCRIADDPSEDCCVLEPSRCSADGDCLGRRRCREGLCEGDSECDAFGVSTSVERSRDYLYIAHEDCLCYPGMPCLYEHGLPCAVGCSLRRLGATAYCTPLPKAPSALAPAGAAGRA